MSRCFPYRPPSYKKEDLSVIGSIENGWGNKKRRKELNLYMKEKPNKKRSRDELDNLDALEHKNKRRRDDEKRTKFTGSWHDKKKYDLEHLERSDLSEEHTPPVFVLNHCSFLESTTKSSQKNGVQDPDPNKKRPGMVLRLKFSKKPKVQELAPSTIPCTTSQVSNFSRTQAVFSTDSTHRPNESSLLKQSFSVKEEPCFSGRVAEAPIPLLVDGIVEADPIKSGHKSVEADLIKSGHKSVNHRHHHTPKSERGFRELVVNWKPPPLQSHEPDEEDLDWLFASRRQPTGERSTAPSSSKATISQPSTCAIPKDSLQPRACYLPEFDMYQLPYVIPF